MSWMLGKKSPKPASGSLADADMRSSTPTPGNPSGRPQSASGFLTVSVCSAEGLELPAGADLPPAIKAALESAEAQVRSLLALVKFHCAIKLTLYHGNRHTFQCRLRASLKPDVSTQNVKAFTVCLAGGYPTSSWNLTAIRFLSALWVVVYKLLCTWSKRNCTSLLLSSSATI